MHAGFGFHAFKGKFIKAVDNGHKSLFFAYKFDTNFILIIPAVMNYESQVDKDGNGSISLSEYFGIFEEHGIVVNKTETNRLVFITELIHCYSLKFSHETLNMFQNLVLI